MGERRLDRLKVAVSGKGGGGAPVEGNPAEGLATAPQGEIPLLVVAAGGPGPAAASPAAGPAAPWPASAPVAQTPAPPPGSEPRRSVLDDETMVRLSRMVASAVRDSLPHPVPQPPIPAVLLKSMVEAVGEAAREGARVGYRQERAAQDAARGAITPGQEGERRVFRAVCYAGVLFAAGALSMLLVVAFAPVLARL